MATATLETLSCMIIEYHLALGPVHGKGELLSLTFLSFGRVSLTHRFSREHQFFIRRFHATLCSSAYQGVLASTVSV